MAVLAPTLQPRLASTSPLVALLAAAGALSAASFAVAQGGQLIGLDRTTTVVFRDLTFDGAIANLSSTQTRQYIGGVAPAYTIGLVGGAVAPNSVILSTTGVSTASLVSVGTDSFAANYGATGPGTGTINTILSLLPLSGARFDRFIRDGHWVLHLESTVSAINWRIGSPISIAQRIPGDWTLLGTATGQITNLTTSSGWTVTNNLTFDGTFTTLRIADTWQNQGGAVTIGFDLIGAAIPSPGTGLALLVLTCPLATRRCRRA